MNSAVDAHAFSVELSATWRVTDPEVAVRDNLSDPGGLVLGCLQDLIWQVARSFEPERAGPCCRSSASRSRSSRDFWSSLA